MSCPRIVESYCGRLEIKSSKLYVHQLCDLEKNFSTIMSMTFICKLGKIISLPENLLYDRR